MKHIKLIILLCLAGQCLLAQAGFLPFEQALVLAEEQEKPVILVFSGSDWCKPCIKFKKEILESSEFQSLSEELILLYLDFPYKKKNALSKEEQLHNEALAETYNPQGSFPKILLLDEKGAIVKDLAYSKTTTPATFIQDLQTLETH